MLFRRALPLATAACAALLLAACGGGGDDAPAPPPPAQPTVAISQANEEPVATAVANAVINVGGFAAVTPAAAGDRVSTAAKTAGGAAALPVHAGSLGAVLQRLTVDAALAPLQPQSREKFLGVVRPQVAIPGACLPGGSLDITVVDADSNGRLSSGDSGTVTFTACQPEAGVTINGSITVVYTGVTESATARSVTATASYSNISVTAPEGSFSLNGSLSLALAQQGSTSGGVFTATQSQATLTIGAGGLTSSVAAAVLGYSETLTLGAGLTISATENLAGTLPGGGTGLLFTSSINGAISSSRLANNGTILVQTVTPFQTVGDDLFPSVGQVVVTGTGNSKLRLTAVSNVTVEIAVDANGDGSYERIVVRNWDSLI